MNFTADFDLAAVGTSDARVALVAGPVGQALRITTGHAAPWPGVTLKAKASKWDLSRRTYLSVTVRNADARLLRVHCRVDNAGADGVKNCVTASISIQPGQRSAILVLLTPHLLEGGPLEFIGMRGDPPVTSKLDPARVTQLVVFLDRPQEDHTFEIERVEAGGWRAPPKPVAASDFFPMIDPFGQYVHADWPGKTHSLEELHRAVEAEEQDLKAHPGPKNWDRYGGWSGGPQFEASGFFRVAKQGGRWWLIDPDGRLFWSHGIDCVHASAATPISDREHYFQRLPEQPAPLARFYGQASWAPHGYYHDHRPFRTYDFFPANLLRKYGSGWESAFAEVTQRRLRSWGLNTIGNWSDGHLARMRRTPYVATINSGGVFLEGSKGYWGKFHDVFDPSFARSLGERLAREAGQSAGDPWCIGYFVDNELGWGDEISLAAAALASPADQAAKRAFSAELEQKYGAIEKLNAAWGSQHADWDALRECREPPEVEKAKADLTAFYTRTAEVYFRTVRDAVRAVAPNQLYLGCRFAWVNGRAARAAAKYCDVISYNRYAYSVEDLRLPDGIDRPTIIGEFHFGALDRGMFHTGLRQARDQAHRAELYRNYVLGALANPQIVGTHWFQYKDQATTGRFDGENYQIGFIDICDRPYAEIVQACRAVASQMYEVRFRVLHK